VLVRQGQGALGEGTVGEERAQEQLRGVVFKLSCA